MPDKTKPAVILSRQQLENQRMARQVFWWAGEEPITCLVQNEDIHWCFFGMPVQEIPCYLISECYRCWPRCAYCWDTCDFDSMCDDPDCATHINWAGLDVSTITGPPWFQRAYAELQHALETTPWRPPPFIHWRAPMTTSPKDDIVYYPSSLTVFRVSTLLELWNSINFLSYNGEFFRVPSWAQQNEQARRSAVENLRRVA